MICSDGSGYGVLVYQLIDPDLGPVFTKEPLDGTDLTCSFYFPGLDLLTANKFNVDQPRDSKGRWMPAGMAKGTGRTPSAAGQSAMVHAALGKKADVSSHVEAIHTLRSRGADLSKEEITAHVNRLGRHLNKTQVHDVARGVGVVVAKTKKDTLAAIHEHLSSRTATSMQASSQAPAAKVGTVSPTVPNSHAELAQATAGKQGFTGPFQRGPYTVVRHDDSGHTIEAEAGSHSGRFAVKDPSNVVHSRHDTAEAAVAAIPSVNRIGTSQGAVDKELRDRAAQVGKSRVEEPTTEKGREKVASKSKGTESKANPVDPMSGHPFAGKSKQELAIELASYAFGHNSPHDPWQLSKGPLPPGATGVRQGVLEELHRAKAESGFNRPSIPNLYDAARRTDPSLRLYDFQRTLVHMQQRGEIRLDPYTQATATIPRPEASLPLDREIKYFVDTGHNTPAPSTTSSQRVRVKGAR